MTALTKPDQPTATRKHDTEEDTREAHGRHIKQAAKAPPHHKAEILKTNMCARRVYNSRGAKHNTR